MPLQKSESLKAGVGHQKDKRAGKQRSDPVAVPAPPIVLSSGVTHGAGAGVLEKG